MADQLSFEDFIKSLPTKPVVKKKKIPTGSTNISPSAQTELENSQINDAFLSASNAGSELLQAIAQYKTGAISKAQAAAVYATYTQKIANLSELDPTRASNIQNSILGKQTTATTVKKTTADTLPTKATPTSTQPFTTPMTVSGQVTKSVTKLAPTGPSGPPKVNTPPPAAGVKLTPEQAHDRAIAALQASGNMGEFAVQMGLINSDDSLKALFYKDIYDPIMAGKDPVSVDLFKAHLINTEWYKSITPNARTAEAIRLGDAPAWKESMAAASGLIKDNALALGYDISDDQITKLADLVLHKSGGKAENVSGLTLDFLKKQVTSIGKINFAGGTAATGLSSLKTFAADYGVSQLYSEATLKDMQDRIEKGTLTQAAAELAIKNSAKSIYNALAPQIDAGFTTSSILSPYKQLYGQILEKDPNAIALSDTQFMSNIFAKDTKDPNIQTLKPLWQYQQDLKNDPSWAYTKNAKDSIDSTAHSILTSLGLTW
jgi:hypothetical protein